MGGAKLPLVGLHLLVLLSLPPRTIYGQEVVNICEMLKDSDLGNTSIPSSEGLLAAHQGFRLQILETHTVCLGQGVLKNRYRSVSVLVRYRKEDDSEEVVQVEYQCEKNEWVKPSVTSPPRANFSTPLRTDCALCSPESFAEEPISDQHCQRMFKQYTKQYTLHSCSMLL